MHRCIQAWEDLSTCRSIGFAAGPIPVTAIWAWCDRRGLDDEAAELVEHVIRTLDVQRAEAEAAKTADRTARGAQAKGRR